jgi:hypothetical protein
MSLPAGGSLILWLAVSDDGRTEVLANGGMTAISQTGMCASSVIVQSWVQMPYERRAAEISFCGNENICEMAQASWIFVESTDLRKIRRV